MRYTVTVHRHNAPSWDFEWDEHWQKLIHRTKHNTYALFFDDPSTTCKPIWIGRLFDGNKWGTCETALGAKVIVFCGSKVFFS